MYSTFDMYFVKSIRLSDLLYTLFSVWTIMLFLLIWKVVRIELVLIKMEHVTIGMLKFKKEETIYVWPVPYFDL